MAQKAAAAAPAQGRYVSRLKQTYHGFAVIGLLQPGHITALRRSRRCRFLSHGRKPLLVQDAAATAAGADLLPVLEHLVSHPRRLAALAANQHEVAGVHRGFPFEDPALDV